MSDNINCKYLPLYLQIVKYRVRQVLISQYVQKQKFRLMYIPDVSCCIKNHIFFYLVYVLDIEMQYTFGNSLLLKQMVFV